MRADGLVRKIHAPTPEVPGFILVDREWKVIHANPEARKILAYPEAPDGSELGWTQLQKRIFPLFAELDSSTSRSELMSGRRKYVSRAFPLTESQGGRPSGAALAVMLERGGAASRLVAEVCERFHLTARERESLELLVEGLTNKEIAARMGISPSTVATFMRIIMLKLGVSTRSGIVGVVFRAIDTPCRPRLVNRGAHSSWRSRLA